MKNRLPEEVPPMTEAEEIELLINCFGGNEAIMPARGDHNLLDVMLNDLRQSDTPSEFVRKLEQKFAGALIIARHLARFDRDQRIVAYRHTEALMKDAHYHVPGYPYPLEKTRPITVLVLDFDLLCLIAKWIRVSPQDHLGQCSLMHRTIDPLTEEAIRRLPTLEANSSTTTEAALACSYQDEMLKRFPEAVVALEKCVEEDRNDYNIPIGKHRAYGLRKCGNRDGYRNMGYILNMSQGDVLRQFFPDRKDQDQIATWEFRVPAGLRLPVDVGFHPERFHQNLKIGGANPSIGLKCGYGAAAMSTELYVMTDYLKFFDAHPHESGYGLEQLEEGDPFAFALRSF